VAIGDADDPYVVFDFTSDYKGEGPQTNPGPYEAALAGHQLVDPMQPVEILRTIHSFDPCIACAVHVTDPNGDELVQVKIR
jgi:hydrogenase large subunit